jgi:hypothetical protein
MELVPIRRHPTAFRQRRRIGGRKSTPTHLVSRQGERNVTTPRAYYIFSPSSRKKKWQNVWPRENIFNYVKDPPCPTPSILDMKIVAQDIR